jgi:tetratricopeptide (TPR) repeat protein
MDSGIGCLRLALDGEPDNIAYRVMLVRALTDSGRPKEALEIATRPAGSSPPELALWHARAEAAQKSSDHTVAAESWRVLCTACPDDWRSWANYGDALATLERWPDTANALRRAVSLNPNERAIHENFASALARAGFYDEAADQLTAMLDSGPEDTGVRLTLARLLADLGRQEDSIAQLDRAAQAAVGGAASGQNDSGLIRIALGDRNDSAPLSTRELRALHELALLLERTNRMEALRNLLGEADRAGISRDLLGYPAAAVVLRDGDGAEAKRLLTLDTETDPVRWNRLMAKILDALGDPEGAFAAADTMNRAVSDFDGWIRRGAEYRRRIRALATTITPEWSAKLQPLEPGPRAAPAFLVGFPRSGTTLLDTFLMGHPDTEVIEERHMLGAAETVLGNIAQLPLRSPEQLEQARSAYFAELDRHVDRTFTGLIVDKLPLNMLGLSAIYSLFPDARIIFAQRHPCDAVLSAFMQSFTLNDAMACFLTIEDGADFYDATMTLFTRSRDALPLASHTLVYEELVADSGRVLKPLIAFLGLEWRPELLDHRATAKSRGAIITPSYDQVIQPLSKAPSGRWHRYEKQLAPALPALLPWAERLGYAY